MFMVFFSLPRLCLIQVGNGPVRFGCGLGMEGFECFWFRLGPV